MVELKWYIKMKIESLHIDVFFNRLCNEHEHILKRDKLDLLETGRISINRIIQREIWFK